MTENNYIPEGYHGIKVVRDLFSLINEDFDPVANVVLCSRDVEGDFDALAREAAQYFNLGKEEIFIKYKEREKLVEFQSSLHDEGLIACVERILWDMDFLHSAGVRPHFRLLKFYTADKTTHQFHVDGLEQDFDRYMTCYNAPVTEYVRNDDVLSVYGHRALCKPEAQIYHFRVGDIWKARVRNKKSNVMIALWRKMTRQAARRAFVHRAPKSDHPRIMVVGDKSKLY